MTRSWTIGVLVAALAATGTYIAMSQGRADTETVVRDYILDHPEIIPQAMERLQQRQSAERVSAAGDDLTTPFAGGWAGNPSGAVTVVEFFDYACGFCRQSIPDIRRLLSENDDVKIVFRELPILSPESHDAARVSLSAARQGDYLDFHRALFEAGRPGERAIAAASRVAGLDAQRTQRDLSDPAIDAEIGNNLQLARQLGISGTPVFVVGDQLMEGAVGYERLQAAVEEARSAGA